MSHPGSFTVARIVTALGTTLQTTSMLEVAHVSTALRTTLQTTSMLEAALCQYNKVVRQ